MKNDPDKNVFNIDAYVKRPDLRPSEIDTLVGVAMEDLQSWQWWIHSSRLYEDELGSDPKEISALLIPVHKEILGLPDPIRIINYFCECHEMGVYPPAWVMNDLYERFSAYLSDGLKGKKNRLGEYFGEPKRGTRSGAFCDIVKKPIIGRAVLDVEQFYGWFGIHKNVAYDLVAQYLAAVENKTDHRIQIGYAAIEAAYKNDEGLEYYRKLWREKPPTREDKEAMLQRYSRESLDPYLNKYPILKEYIK